MIFYSESTWPQHLIDFLDKHFDVLMGYEQHDAKVMQDYLHPDNKLPMAFMPANPFAEEYESITLEIENLLQSETLLGWHCTRLTEYEVEKIQQEGMLLPSLELLKNRISCLQNKGLISTQIANRLKSENRADEEIRRGMLWFCFFPPSSAYQSGIERFFRYWGGEALYRCHEDDPQTGEALMSIGQPYLIEAAVPISSLALNFFGQKVARQYLINRGFQATEPTEHEDRAFSPIAAENIVRCIVHGDPDFSELTGCDSWSPPLQ